MIGSTFIFLPIARDVIKHILCSHCFFLSGGGGGGVGVGEQVEIERRSKQPLYRTRERKENWRGEK